MNKKIELLPHVIAFLSIIFVGIFLRYNLYIDSKKFAHEFIAQNATEIYSADTYKLSTKLNRLNAATSWACLIGSVNKVEFFSIKNDNCENGLFRHRLVLYTEESGIKLEMTLKFSNEKIAIFSIYIFFQICILLSVYTVVRFIEKNRQKEVKEFNRRAMILSHDIRSPLESLSQVIKNELINISIETKNAMLHSVNIIKKSANELLEFNDKDILPVPISIKNCISESLELKKREYPSLEILINVVDDVYGLCVEHKLNRAISNILNNSIEASENKFAKINIDVKANEGFVEIYIKDNGKGIPKEILENLGKRNITTKSNGNGLGLMGIIHDIRSWGGSFEVVETGLNGTVLKIALIQHVVNHKAVLIDDDELTRLLWQNKADKVKLDLYCYEDIPSFEKDVNLFNLNTTIYIDNYIKDKTGKELALDLHERGFKSIYFVTGSSKEEFDHLHFIKGILGKQPPF